MTFGFQPADDKVLVRLMHSVCAESLDAEWAEVVAVGPGRRTADGAFVPLDLNVGDCIATRPHSVVHMQVRGEALAVVSAPDVLGVLLHVEGRSGPAAVGMPDNDIEAAPALHTASTAESPETDIAPDLLDREAPTSEDLH